MRKTGLLCLVGVPLITVACGDVSVVKIQEPPEVTIQEPSNGSSFYTGQTVTFKALVQTYDGTELESVTHQWVSGEQTICISDAVPADGYALCTWSYDSPGEKTATVTITDPALQSASATITINIIENSPPTIEIQSPIEDELYAVDELIVFQALVDDAEESSENLLVTVSSNSYGEVTSNYATSSGQYDDAALITDAGEHLLTFRVTDSYGRTAQDTVKIEVYEHVPPVIESVSVTPPRPTTTDDLTAVPQNWYDPDGSPERNRYQWYISDADGKLVVDTSETTVSYPAAKTSKGDLLQVAVTPYNDYGDGSTVLSATVEVVNSAPSTPLVYIEPASPEPTDNLFLQCLGLDRRRRRSGDLHLRVVPEREADLLHLDGGAVVRGSTMATAGSAW